MLTLRMPVRLRKLRNRETDDWGKKDTDVVGRDCTWCRRFEQDGAGLGCPSLKTTCWIANNSALRV